MRERSQRTASERERMSVWGEREREREEWLLEGGQNEGKNGELILVIFGEKKHLRGYL